MTSTAPEKTAQPETTPRCGGRQEMNGPGPGLHSTRFSSSFLFLRGSRFGGWGSVLTFLRRVERWCFWAFPKKPKRQVPGTNKKTQPFNLLVDEKRSRNRAVSPPPLRGLEPGYPVWRPVRCFHIIQSNPNHPLVTKPFGVNCCPFYFLGGEPVLRQTHSNILGLVIWTNVLLARRLLLFSA